MLKYIKRITAVILCNDLSGRLLALIFNNKIPCWRYGNLRIDCSSAHILPVLKASIFWGIYEGSEIRFIQKWIKDDKPVIELGGSIGVLSSHLGQIVKNHPIYIIEAHPQLSTAIEQNMALNKVANAKVYSMGIGSASRRLFFSPGDSHITGSITDQESEDAIKIHIEPLSKFIQQNNIQKFNLICDIEGGEVSILKNDAEALRNCDLVIIETHATTLEGNIYTSEDIKTMFLKQNFELLDQEGINFVFRRKTQV